MTDEREPTRPTPVRAAATPPRPARDVPPDAVEEPPPQVRDVTDGQGRVWRVEVAGRGRTGLRGVPRADLLLLVFRPEAPGGSAAPSATSGSPGSGELDAREALAVAPDLDALTEGQLAALLEEARPFRADARAESTSPGTGRSPQRRPRRS